MLDPKSNSRGTHGHAQKQPVAPARAVLSGAAVLACAARQARGTLDSLPWTHHAESSK